MSRGTSERGAVLLHTRQACSARPECDPLARNQVQKTWGISRKE